MEIKSVLNDILEDIKGETNIENIKHMALHRIQKSKINQKDKVKMSIIINNKDTHYRVIKSIYDLILKYEGCGVISKSLNGGNLR